MRSRVLPPARLLAVVAPVSVVGVAALAAATAEFALHPGSWTTAGGVAAFLAASVFAERFPVPVEGADATGVSLGFVFAVAALVVFGWAPGTFVYAVAPLIVGLLIRRPAIRTLFNAGSFGLVGSLASLALTRVADGMGAEDELVRVAVAAVVLYAVNLLLVTAAIVASGGSGGYLGLIRSNVRWTVVPFTLMASTALMLVVLWQRTPYLFFSLSGPLLAISLYQRSTHRALSAIRLALTDPLTGLGNQRHFHERLQRALTPPSGDALVSLCLLDVDDFKRINDGHGHPAGDRVLTIVASRLRQGGEAFRLGGDEFAILLPGVDEHRALEIARAVVARIEETDFEHVGEVTVSAGVATFPHHGQERDTLIRLADGALYWAKEHGKNQVRVARPDVAELAGYRHDRDGDGGFARFRAAASLAAAVDLRDGFHGSHSERVGALAERIAERLGLPADQVELTRLAGRLHDVGKLAIPEEILRKPSEPTEAERLVLERHPQIGHRMLASLGAEAIAVAVLHHHERWDGAGYPAGLAGERIPLPSRIVLVADAWDAMVHGRPYAPGLDPEDARREIERCAGSQFDPRVAAALLDLVADRELVGV